MHMAWSIKKSVLRAQDRQTVVAGGNSPLEDVLFQQRRKNKIG